MFRILILFFILIINGCASIPFKVEEEGRERVVNWKTVEDVDGYCRTIIKKPLPPPPLFIINGCATWGPTRCTIYTAPTTTYGILGHEVRHCFDGHFHQ